MKLDIRVLSGPMEGTVFSFEDHDTFIFGRAKDAHCRITGDSAVSRHHFLLEVNPPRARIRDLGSTNGFEVNGERYAGKTDNPDTVDLHDGDRIRVGKTELLLAVEQDTETVAEEPPPKPAGTLRDAVAAAVGRKTTDGEPEIPGYEMEKKLGEGGMGSVWLARNADGARVAVKIMKPDMEANERQRKLFLREIDLTRDLRHPNIVEFHESGDVGDFVYLALEYLPGGSLDGWIAKSGGTAPYQRALAVFLHAIDGLSHAHMHGFVHRDIKPQNILLGKRNGKATAKIGDFGLAKNFQQAGLSGFTTTGTKAGTPGFMPREQLTDFRNVNPASDVFSMGATLYCMLTGESPYDFDRHDDYLNAVLDGDMIPLLDRAPETPKPLADIIATCLRPDAQDRYPHAAALRKAVRGILKG